MKTPNNIERDLDRIRLKIYEETKHMTSAQYVEHIRKSAEEGVKKLGFKFIIDADNKRRLVKICP